MYFSTKRILKNAAGKSKRLGVHLKLPEKTIYLKLLEHIEDIQDTADFIT